MGWFTKKPGAWDLATVERPWQGDASIHAQVVAGAETLPDERPRDGGLRWAPGGLDGTFGHHGEPGAAKDQARLVHRALRVVLEDASAPKLKKLYEQVLAASAMEYVDPLLERIVDKEDLDRTRLRELAVWLVRNAPDREAVKLGLALLGLGGMEEDLELLDTLGRHEELTLFAAVAIRNALGADADAALFRLAHHVDGWGRIHLIEQLGETQDPAIQAWMLREGYRNNVMYEYVAYTCATAGGLRRELERDAIDQPLLDGAGDLIEALIEGGPAQDMSDYDDGPVVVERYLHHLAAAPPSLRHLGIVGTVLRFLDGAPTGWPAALGAQARAIVARPEHADLVRAGLSSEDDATFRHAKQAARTLGLDAWDVLVARLDSGAGDDWYEAMQTDDPARIDRVVALAEARLPLDAIASGPARELGLGAEWAPHQHLVFVVQELRRFPGTGWPLVHASLRSPVVRNRNAALRVLEAWGRAAWPAAAEAALRRAHSEEPEPDVRTALARLLAVAAR